MKLFLFLIITWTLLGCSTRQNQGTSRVVLASQVTWEKLNPARGEKSPQAGTL